MPEYEYRIARRGSMIHWDFAAGRDLKRAQEYMASLKRDHRRVPGTEWFLERREVKPEVWERVDAQD